jgi:murein DD-endopeptidase MepM/ murein hydrolase activator NlpD
MPLRLALFRLRKITGRSSKSVGLVGPLMVALIAVSVAQAAGHHQLQDRATASDRAADSLAAQIDSDSKRIDAAEMTIAAAGAELANLRNELARSRAKLVALEGELRQTETDLSFARSQLKLGQERLAARLVAAYTSTEPDVVTILLGAESLDDALEGMELQDRRLTQDRDLVAEVTGERNRLARARARLAALRRAQAAETASITRKTAEQQATLSALVAQRESLVALRSQRRQSLAKIEVQRDAWEQQAAALEAQSARLASVASAAPPSPNLGQAVGAPAGGAFIWPVRGAVVSPYGQRWGRLHSGIDIAAPAGTPIAASATGQVVFSGSMSGYGNLVVIQHAGGIATAYAHNSSNAVGVGQSVGQGQTIGYVGCTGHCFGDHVHFEVRVNGAAVDPAGYL